MTDRYMIDIEPDRVVELAAQLIRIDTSNPPGQEAAAALSLGDWLRAAGADVEVVDHGPGRKSVVGSWGAPDARPHLALVGHLDTVPAGSGWDASPLSGEIKDGRLYGRGSSDMKGGLAAMAVAAATVSPYLARNDACLSLVGVADEEVGQLGTRELVERGFRPDFAIMGEPTDLVPMIAHKGDMYIEVITHGVDAHAGYPERGVNAIDHMAEIVMMLKKLNEELVHRRHPILGSPTLSVGTIEGGVIGAMVPGRCRIVVDRRVLPGETADRAVGEVRELIQRVAVTNSSVRAETQAVMFTPAAEIPPTSPVAQACRRAVHAVTNADPGLHGWSATSDANIFINEAGIPTVILGPGSIIAQAHRPNESVPVDELIVAANVYALVAADLLALPVETASASLTSAPSRSGERA